MDEETGRRLLALLLTPFTVGSVVSFFYLRHISGLDPRPKGSWILRMMVVVSAMVLVPTLWFEVLTLFRVFVSPALPTWTSIISTILLFVLLSIPTYKAITVYRRRRRSGGTPPPLGSTD
jgi:hypothetical protein